MRFSPVYRLVIGSAEVDATREVGKSTVVLLTLACDMTLLADRVELALAPVGGIQPTGNEDLAIELGFDDSLTRVFTGTVAEVVPGITAVRVVGLSSVRALIGLRVEKTYERRTAGDIVRDLAGQARVNPGTIEDGIRLPFYAIDGGLSAAAHIHRLAERCGFDAYVRPTGELEFRQFAKTAADHVFTYGQDILDYTLTVRSERAAAVVVDGESPASAQGEDAASWLTKAFQRGRAGGGSGVETVLLRDPAMRTTEAATQRAEGALRRFRQRARTGTVRALGRPEVRLGDAIRIEGAPDARLNNVYQVRALRHRLSRRVGLITDIAFWSLP